ncbi:MAG: DNA mismatch repair endonuclease MutH [Pseudomonadota bacterium]
MLRSPAPTSRDELMTLAHSLAGLTVAEIAAKHHLEVPENLQREKGWVGQLLEVALGCEAGSSPDADYPDLGVELKTLPLDSSGYPLESTYVSVVPLTDLHRIHWENSVVKAKLSCVLWVPTLSEVTQSLIDRKIGTPLLWTPTADELRLLRQDFEEHIENIALGGVESISAKHGNVLQIRPKAADSKKVTLAVGRQGSLTKTLPRGFYLRPAFTASLISQYYKT